MNIYCSYEVSKLLRDKGFNEKCVGWYINNWGTSEGIRFGDNTTHTPGKSCSENYRNSTWKEMGGVHWEYFSAPTHQEALDWLWNEHKIFIGISPSIVQHPEPGVWYKVQTKAIVYNTKDGSIFGDLPKKVFCEYSTEKAVEEAIMYALENMV